MECIFCKIVAGEIPSYKVYEDEDLLAFLDAFPVTEGHLLLIPKKHFAQLEDLPTENLTNIFSKAQELRPKIKQALNSSHVIMSVVGEEVPHMHIQFIPRTKEDGLVGWSTTKLDEQQAQEVLTKLKKVI